MPIFFSLQLLAYRSRRALKAILQKILCNIALKNLFIHIEINIALNIAVVIVFNNELIDRISIFS